MRRWASTAPPVTVFLFAVALAGCSTPYGERGALGGFVDKVVDDGIAVVVVSGNAFTAPERVMAMATLRGAELTVQQGFRRFTLLTIEDQGAADALKAGRLRAYLYDRAAQPQSGPSLIISTTTVTRGALSVPLVKAGGGLFVVMYKDKGGAYDAGAVIKNLRPQLAPTDAERAQAPPPAAAGRQEQ
jgi:ABC-type amino acid transport substrate-binding protein